MFSYIEGSTEKTDRLGDKAWMEVLRDHNTILYATGASVARRARFTTTVVSVPRSPCCLVAELDRRFPHCHVDRADNGSGRDSLSGRARIIGCQ